MEEEKESQPLEEFKSLSDRSDSELSVSKKFPEMAHSKKKRSKKKHSKSKSIDWERRKKKSNNSIESIKELEELSDEDGSIVSDIHPRSFLTRSRRRKEERRSKRALSSCSSVVGSCSRKAESEPLLITLDSDSDGGTSYGAKRSERHRVCRKNSSKSVKSDFSSDNEDSRFETNKRNILKRQIKAKVVKRYSSHRKIGHISALYASRKRKEKLRIINLRHSPERKAKVSKSSAPAAIRVSRRNSTIEDTAAESVSVTSETGGKRKKGRPRKFPKMKINNSSESLPLEAKIKDASNNENADCIPDDSEQVHKIQKKFSDNEEADSKAAEYSDPEDSYRVKDGSSRGARSSKKKKTHEDFLKRGRGRPKNEETNLSRVLTDISDVVPQKPFLQSSFCFDVASKISKCRECRIAVYKNSRHMYNSYCRFMEYRKLCHNKNGLISSAGFSSPSDATEEHLNVWLPRPQEPPSDLNYDTAKSLLEHVGDHFCNLVEQESEALKLHMGLNQLATWKRIVQGVREMCDVCSTTIFNIHWVCPICGFAVCIDCYKARKMGIIPEEDEDLPKDRDEYKWLLCTVRQPHLQDSLLLTQIIPHNALWKVRDYLHRAQKKLNIASRCKCNNAVIVEPLKPVACGINKQLMSCVSKSFPSEPTPSYVAIKKENFSDHGYGDLDVPVSDSARRWLDVPDFADVNYSYVKDEYDFDDINPSDCEESDIESKGTPFTLDEILSFVKTSCEEETGGIATKNFSLRYPQINGSKEPIRMYTKLESDLQFSNVPHSWFCNGRLLFLHEAVHEENLSLFQEQWKRGQPIMVKGVHEALNMSLWHPDGFCRDFGEVRNDLVDCKTGSILKNLPMKKFWEGFENFGKRLKDENGDFLLLKLKDWPPGEDFSEKLPTRFNDLMRGLPLPEYTHRDGILNLAGRLPSSFVKPDLGPKMYNAYGSALFPTKGTTNLHLDISDAVNVMVYVGISSDESAQDHIVEALKAIDEGGCDSLMRDRVNGRDVRPGALWHIYNAQDADKIRDMLTKVAIERGDKLEANTDPIHDQSWYIDTELRCRLYNEYGVEGYAIAQCIGDAVFIPAGAPHQVRNLHSCVKVAEDFVSSENIGHCFKLTQEFRNLSDTHSNHEDKLQIKNIIYHVVKDALSILLSEDEIKN